MTWIMMESLKLALSMLDNKLDVYYAAAADVPGGLEDEAGLLLVVADMVPPVFAISLFKLYL
jgi:hypothetical protein